MYLYSDAYEHFCSDQRPNSNIFPYTSISDHYAYHPRARRTELFQTCDTNICENNTVPSYWVPP